MADETPPSRSGSPYAPAALAGIPGAASVAAATCGTACAGACAPSLLGLLGLSGSAALASWTTWLRPIFLAITVGSLALAFFRAYRRPRLGQRFVESRVFVWVMAVLCLGLVGLPYGTGVAAGGDAPPCARPCPPESTAGGAPSAPPCPLAGGR
jgi:hypothetical protein